MSKKNSKEFSELYDYRDISKILKVNERYARIVMVQPQLLQSYLCILVA